MKAIKSPPDESEVNLETVFEVGAEGGSLRIFRQRNGSKYIFYHNEFDPLDDETLVSVKKEYETFNQAFQNIERYPWYSLYIVFVHMDFRDFVIKRLNNILIEKSASMDPSNFDSSEVISRIQENLLRSISDRIDIGIKTTALRFGT
jgi:hypothetical protein